MDNKKFFEMSKNIPKFRVRINPRLAVQRGGMVGWVTMLTLGGAVGLTMGYFKVYYPYTFRTNKNALIWKAEPDFLTNSIGFKVKSQNSSINHML